MKKILFLIVYIILLSCSAQNNSNRLEKVGIFGNIEKYQVIKMEILDEPKMDTTQIETFLYNDMNKLIEAHTKILIPNYSFSKKIIYNKKNQRIKEIWKTNNKRTSEYIYIYKNDLVIDINSKQKNKNKIKYFNNHLYYDNAELIKSKFKLYHIIQETNDTIYIETGTLHFKNEFLIKEISKKYYPDYSITFNNTYIRDKKGLLKEKIELIEEEKLKFTYKYEFDKQGSWIEQKEFKDGKLNYIQKRVISYK
jgi:hypothetical protein